MTNKCILCGKDGLSFGSRTDYNKYDSADPSGKTYGIRKVYNYLKCSQCGLWWTQNVDDDYNKLYETEKYWWEHHKRMGWNTLDETPRIENDIKYSKMRRPFIKQFFNLSSITHRINILEIGSSTGTMLKEFYEDDDFNLIIGVEPNDRVANQAARFSRCSVIKNLNNGKPLDHGFDLVVAIDVLEHIANPLEECKKWLDNLSSCGILYLELPDAGCDHAINNGVNWDYVMHEHVYYYSKQNVIDLFKKFGCENIHCDNWLTTDRQRLVFQKGV